MSITVVCAEPAPAANWQVELLEWSWRRCGQPGALVRLAPGATPGDAPRHLVARAIAGPSWRPHPYTDDDAPDYGMPASLLAWLLEREPDGTVLVLEAGNVFTVPVTDTVEPGRLVAQPWDALETGHAGPFGLPEVYQPLATWCVHRDLPLPLVRFPALVHAADLRRVTPRWLELTTLLRCVPDGAPELREHASRLAFCIAIAEYGIEVEARALLGGSDAPGSGAGGLLACHEPILGSDDEAVFDPATYQPWSLCPPERAAADPGRAFLALLQEYVSLRDATGHLAGLRPRRCPGVREARVMDRMLLEVPGEAQELTLNASAAEIWRLCDGERSLEAVIDDLERRFDVPRKTLADDVETAVRDLRAAGALDLDVIAA